MDFSFNVKNSKKIKTEPKLLFKLGDTDVVQDFYVTSRKKAAGNLNVYIGSEDNKTDLLLTTINIEKGETNYFSRGQISLKLSPNKAVYLSSDDSTFDKKSLKFVFGLRSKE